MKIRKRIGPKTDPWGTPDKTGTGSEAWPSKTTRWLRPESHELIHLWVDPRIPYFLCDITSADPEGGTGPPPWKITSYMGFYRE